MQPLLHDISGTMIFCLNGNKQSYLCKKNSCSTAEGKFYFNHCKLNGQNKPDFYVWPTEFTDNPGRKNSIYVKGGYYSPTLQGNRTTLSSPNVIYCTWATASDHNAMRPDCNQCEKWQ
ncbi:hypothetical protein O181_044846 [Austropuccinia psidii MF-1]|uniref:Uncharacterized protein n=1 Tax=Austropuccinia psidii MF-1 TaxID=1389203 RepID=A0A9Q3DR70_9BASI|nr:hypothetical protein [Austropuccinia psidii MF-1]